MPKRKSWTVQDIEKAVCTSHSIREVIIKIGLIPAGGNYHQIRKAIEDNAIDTKHFTGQGWRKNKTFVFSPRKELKDILKKRHRFSKLQT